MKSDDCMQTKRVYHWIDKGGPKPIRQPLRKLPLAKREEVAQIIDSVQRHGVVEESRQHPVMANSHQEDD
jgi:hypothetical protein